MYESLRVLPKLLRISLYNNEYISNRHRARRLLLIYQIVDIKSMQIKAKSGNDLFFTANNYVGKKALLKKMHVRDSRHFIKLANVA